jgi:hypothetical protein
MTKIGRPEKFTTDRAIVAYRIHKDYDDLLTELHEIECQTKGLDKNDHNKYHFAKSLLLRQFELIAPEKIKQIREKHQRMIEEGL